MKKLTIIIPCFNEIKTIATIINKILNLGEIEKQIIVVDDNSTDGSIEIIKQFQNQKKIDVIFHNSNEGKGACIISAQKLINGNVVIIQDADLEYDPQDIPKLIKPILDKDYLVVYGSRVLKKKYFENLRNFSHWIRILGNLILTFISNFVNKQRLTDAHTCYKAFDAELFKKINLKEKNFNFCPEITTKISNRGIKILELPISYKGRDYNEGKKIKYTDAFKAIYCILKYKFF
tara:strand:+ start:1403 stop:2104 length:702 start_codon:yes stop_codon:yes gene_type:complete